MGITCKVFRSSEDVPWDDWERVRRCAAGGNESILMDRRFLGCIEQSMSEMCKLWRLVYYSGTGEPIATACISTFRVDMAAIAGPCTRRFIMALRRPLPSLCKVNVLFCGVPVSVGQGNLLFDPGADLEQVLMLLDQEMVSIAKAEKARLIVMKEHPASELKLLKPLTRYGYREAASLGSNYFEEDFRDFDDYLSNLTSHYRYDIRRSQRKMRRAGIEVNRWTDPDEIQERYTSEVHELYLAVVENSESKLEILPRDFFHELTRAFPRQLALTGLVRDKKILAFNWSLTMGEHYQFLFCGIDYKENRDADLYFNLMYAELDFALRSGARDINLGQTASQFKARLGCKESSLYLLVKALGPFTRLLLGAGFKWMFPPRSATPRADIYNSKYHGIKGVES